VNRKLRSRYFSCICYAEQEKNTYDWYLILYFSITFNYNAEWNYSCGPYIGYTPIVLELAETMRGFSKEKKNNNFNLLFMLYCFSANIRTIQKIAVLLVVAPCSLVEVYQRFRGPCCLHHQGDRPDDGLHGATTQKTAIFILTAVRTSNLTKNNTVYIWLKLSPTKAKLM
jgi:hypothetical protein